jgi:hypothetical protein
MNMTRPAPPCPECGGVRYWYGSVEFWVGNGRSPDDNLNAAVCGDCGYSSLYLQKLPEFRQALAARSAAPPAGDPAAPPAGDPKDAPGLLAGGPADPAEKRAFRKAVREQHKAMRKQKNPGSA